MIIDPTKPPPNRSNAVISKRIEPKDSLDFFPTPAWATRALMEYIITDPRLWTKRVLEPSCGAGHMSEPLKEYFGEVDSADIHDYGYGKTANFLTSEYQAMWYSYVITNPPFNLAEEFIAKALTVATEGVAMLARTSFIETVGRYNRLFSNNAPHIIGQFVERVPMVKGRVDRKASTATSYCWLVWYPDNVPNYGRTQTWWIPPCRKRLEKDSDYPMAETVVEASNLELLADAE